MLLGIPLSLSVRAGNFSSFCHGRGRGAALLPCFCPGLVTLVPTALVNKASTGIIAITTLEKTLGAIP